MSNKVICPPRTVGGDKRKAKLVLANEDMAQVRLIQDTKYWSSFSKYFTWRNLPMYRYTTKSLLTLMGYSQGCIKMLQETGFQCFTKGTGNAGTVLQMYQMHVAMEDSFYCFNTGFFTLIHQLREKLGDLAGDNLDVLTDRRVLAVCPKRGVGGSEGVLKVLTCFMPSFRVRRSIYIPMLHNMYSL